MNKSSELLIEITDNPGANPPAADFYVTPPLSEAEQQSILENQGPGSILAELLTYPEAHDPNAAFGASGFQHEFNFAIGEELAKAVMSIRGLAKAQLTHNGTVHEVLA